MSWRKGLLLQLRTPIILLAIMISVDVAASFDLIRSSGDFFEYLSGIIRDSNRFYVFGFTILEHTVLLNVYFPGAIVIIVAMGATHGDILAAFATYIAILTGQIVGYAISYYAGKFQSSRRDNSYSVAQQAGYFFTFAHPHSAALTCFILGTNNVKIYQFFILLIPSTIFWSLIWAVIAYFGLFELVGDLGWDYIFYSYLIIWIVLISASYLRCNKTNLN